MMKNDSFKLGLTNVFVRIIGLFILVPVYRMLNEEGLLLIAISFVPFIFFTDFCSIGIIPGFSFLTSKYTKENNEDKLNYILFKSKKIMIISGIVFSVLLLALSSLLTNIYDHNFDTKLIKYSFIAIVPTILIFPMMSLYRGYLLGKGSINKVSKSIIIEHLTRFTFIFLSAYIILGILNLPYYIAVISFILASFVGLFFSLIYLRFQVNETFNETKKYKYLKEMFATFLPIGMTTIFITVYLAIDLIVVNRIKDDNMSIFLFTTPRLLIIPILLSQAVAATVMPLITKTNDSIKKSQEIDKAIDMVITVSIGAVFLYLSFSNYIFTLFYGYKKTGIIALKYFSILMLFYSLNKVLIGIIQGIRKLKYIFIASLFSYIMKLILNILFINILGYYTFLFSSTISVLIVITTALVILKKEELYHLKKLFSKLILNIFSAIIVLLPMLLLSSFIQINSNNKFLLAIFLLVIFLVYIISFRRVKKLTFSYIDSYNSSR